MDSTLEIQELRDDELENMIESILRRLYITGKLDGFWYLREALAQIVRNPARVRYITKELYPDIAELSGTTTSRVERCIRTAIEISWRQGGEEIFNQLCNTQFVKRPSNADFLDLLAAYLRG